jgi:hypothetical protein
MLHATTACTRRARHPARTAQAGTHAPAAGAYAHWGVYQPGDSLEPNQLTGNENCGLANYTMGYGGAFGWADAPCESFRASICLVEGGRRPAQAEVLKMPRLLLPRRYSII